MIMFERTTLASATRESMTTKQLCWAAALALPLIAGPAWCFAWQATGLWIGSLAGFILVAALAASAITDIHKHRIYNWATYSAFGWLLVLSILATYASSSEGVLNQTYNRTLFLGHAGSAGLGQCLAGAGLCFLITLFGYHLSSSGAGDVKLATVIGAALGVQYGVFAIAYSYVVAAVAILVWSTWINGPLALVKAALRAVGSVLGPLWPFPPTGADTQLLLRPIPLGPYFAIGTLLVVLEVV